MWISQLHLQHYRNYRRLGLEMQPGVQIFCGRNGQGKTNLLEAVYVLATTRSPRTSVERELVGWRPPDDPETLAGVPSYARLEARVRGAQAETHLEIVFKGEPLVASQSGLEPARDAGAVGEVAGALARSIRVNGLPTRAAGLVGTLTVVSFAPEDVTLASGSPAGRRRYLDLANSQVAPLYLRALQRYNRILAQRNQVLKQIRERRQPRGALEPWTEQMVRAGAYVLRHRIRMLEGVNERAGEIFRALAGNDRAHLRIVYRSTVWDLEHGPVHADDSATRALAQRYTERQEAASGREVEQAVSLVGPHRDDFGFMLDGVDLNTYGSRGQQRLAVLALKLAEWDWMQAETGELPVLLLDDVLSELDPQRRQYVLERVAPSELGKAERAEGRQVWVTATAEDDFSGAFLAAARRFQIDAGTVRPA